MDYQVLLLLLLSDFTFQELATEYKNIIAVVLAQKRPVKHLSL